MSEKINLRSQVSFLPCATSFPMFPITVGNRVGKESYGTTLYYQTQMFFPSPFLSSPPPSAYILFPFSHRRGHKALRKINSRPKFHRLPKN